MGRVILYELRRGGRQSSPKKDFSILLLEILAARSSPSVRVQGLIGVLITFEALMISSILGTTY